MKQTESLKNVVYNSILNGIIQDEYKPGQIINEKELTEKYKVSKSPVREALISLCNAGVLRNIPRYGYEVVRLTREDISDILRFRFILEAGCLRESYQRVGPAQIDRLEELNRLCCDCHSQDDMWTHWKHNQNFHMQLISFANNPYASKELARSMDILNRAYAQFYWDKWRSTVISTEMKSHEKLLKALKNHDIELAVECLRMDLADFGY